jgi:hypothetical protein
MTEINTTPPEVTNLAAAKKEQAAAKKEQAAAKGRHPAGKAPAKAPAKKAPANPAAKIAWKPEGEQNERGEYPSSTGTCGDTEYKITRQADGSFKATVKVGAKAPTVLVADAKSGNAAWKRCVGHSKKGAAA